MLWALKPIVNHLIKPEEKMINTSLTRYLDFCVFDESTNFSLCDLIIETTAY